MVTTPHTPCAEAVEAAAHQIMSGIYLMVGEGTLPRKAAREILAAAFPHLRRQIITECVEELAVYSCACQLALRALLGDATTREGGAT